MHAYREDYEEVVIEKLLKPEKGVWTCHSCTSILRLTVYTQHIFHHSTGNCFFRFQPRCSWTMVQELLWSHSDKPMQSRPRGSRPLADLHGASTLRSNYVVKLSSFLRLIRLHLQEKLPTHASHSWSGQGKQFNY